MYKYFVKVKLTKQTHYISPVGRVTIKYINTEFQPTVSADLVNKKVTFLINTEIKHQLTEDLTAILQHNVNT